MAALMQLPELAPTPKPDYETWLAEVQATLTTLHMEMSAWDENWPYDFAEEYDANVSAWDAAMHARNFWWQELMAESWT